MRCAPRYPWSSLQPIAAAARAAQPPRRCLQARRAEQPLTSRAQMLSETAQAHREKISGDGDSMRAVRSMLAMGARTGHHASAGCRRSRGGHGQQRYTDGVMRWLKLRVPDQEVDLFHSQNT